MLKQGNVIDNLTELARHLIDVAAVDAEDQYGATVLDHAAFRGDIDVMKMLIEAKADINHQDDGGVTPLMNAAANNQKEAVEWLIAQGVNLHLRSENGGWTAVDLCTDSEIIQLLKNAMEKQAHEEVKVVDEHVAGGVMDQQPELQKPIGSEDTDS